jgi:phosphoribosylformylglycinamidine cyclo-ligase
MLRTFNLGIGLILVVRPRDAEGIERALRRRGEHCHRVGRIVRGGRRVVFRERPAAARSGGAA